MQNKSRIFILNEKRKKCKNTKNKSTFTEKEQE